MGLVLAIIILLISTLWLISFFQDWFEEERRYEETDDWGDNNYLL